MARTVEQLGSPSPLIPTAQLKAIDTPDMNLHLNAIYNLMESLREQLPVSGSYLPLLT